ncbi:primosomal protein N' [Bacillus fonticola]|uniref:primosomal protein N' n=1 Tax=Bacillus fonticola TaxID=2728853 RepID=UPI0014751386|nr:primosomal protein N' [Bacillus fonticola]
MIARVIVDVKTLSTDKLYDYLVSKVHEEICQPGMRVTVPFGNRAVQGFVVEVLEKTEVPVEKLKPIQSFMDLAPVLSEELLQCAQWLSEETVSFLMDAHQVMLPAALKADYEKLLVRKSPLKELPLALQPLFEEREEIPYKELEQKGFGKGALAEIRKGHLSVRSVVKDRKTVKQERWVALTTEGRSFEKLLNPQATKQREVCAFLLSKGSVAVKDVYVATNTTSVVVRTLEKNGLVEFEMRSVARDPYKDREFARTTALSLTPPQQVAMDTIVESCQHGKPDTFLLHGVTGSGKTEVYLQTIDFCLQNGKEAIVLVPEISLTPQMVHRFKGRFGDRVAVLHSGLSKGEKYDEWRKIAEGEVDVVVGARSAIFAPFGKLGVIIIDEEHEATYKQEDSPRYHAREVAKWRAKYHGCPVVLGSATPSLESYARAVKGVYTLLEMPGRMNEREMPAVAVVDMRSELREGNRSMFSRQLLEAMEDRLDKKEQIVLFLNKRGYSSFLMCRDCGFVLQCDECDVSMTYHRASNEMKCHYCTRTAPVPAVCPECLSESIRYFGTGTQRVEEELTKLLPHARVIRMDVDTTSRKGSHEKLLDAFGAKKADILLGTQMIAKGLDFPDITLVGVLTADTMLHIPDFRASERTFQLLTQVSGRAGRHEKTGEVIVQTYTPDHYSIQLSKTQHYPTFFQTEMQYRRENSYSPYQNLVLIGVTSDTPDAGFDVMHKFASYLRKSLSEEAVVLGPTVPPIARLKNRYRYQCLIKYKREKGLHAVLKKGLLHFASKSKQISITIDVHPQMFM